MERTSAATYYHEGVTDLKKQQERMQKVSKDNSSLTVAHRHQHSVTCTPAFRCYFYKNGELVE